MKKIRFIVVLFSALCLAAGIFMAVKLTKKWPAETVYSVDDITAFTENGMYYFDSANSILKYYDDATGMSTVVCDKPDCEHKDEKCNGYFKAISPNMLVYGKKMYLNYFDAETYFDENGDVYVQSEVKLEQMNLDGSGRKVLYSSDSGAVLSMYAVDGKLYYTAYQLQNGFEMNTYLNDCTLYCYDMNWGTTKELYTCQASEDYYNANLFFIEVPDASDSLYFLYSYDNREEQRITELMVYHDGVMTEHEFPEHIHIAAVLEDGIYFYIYKEETDSIDFIYADDKGNQICLAEIYAYFDIYYYPGYLYFINTNENRMLYDYRNDIWYAANTAIGKETKWIPDIYYIDIRKDRVYYNPTDFTGTSSDSFITPDMISYDSGSWQEFLQEHYTVYDGPGFEWMQIRNGEPPEGYDGNESEWIDLLLE